MLHNSGSFGPNDVPINMGAPGNMTQISNPINVGNNMHNLAKMPQQTPQPSAPHYSMPDYSSFAHPPLNLGHSINPFANYHNMNFPANYGHPNANLQQDTSLNNVQNGMLPMNLNTQSDHGPSLADYHSFESKIMDVNNPHYKESYSRRMPINIPQLHTKAFQKHIGMDNRYDQYSSIQENPYYSNDLTKPQEKTLMDSNRRKSLENTVKLIENILINNSSKDKLKNLHLEVPSSTANVNTSTISMINNGKSKTNLTNSSTTTKDTKTDIDTIINNDNTKIDSNTNKQFNDTKPESNMTLQSEIHCEPLQRSLLRSRLEKSHHEIDHKHDSVKDMIREVKQEFVQEETKVKIKVEPIATWTDLDSLQPFLKDSNATDKDALEDDAVIVEGENNVSDAISAVLSGSVSNTYYECCHCSLLFKHPKRFLIHTKWHSFGLTNEKRQELLREKEIRKNMKKEARIIERLNSKEVKEKDAEGDAHPCKDCDKVFKVKSSLKNHRQRYHPTRVRNCKICNTTVVGWMALREHLNTHTGGGGYQCSECPKRFKYAHSLAKHKDTHLEKTHGCEQCEKKFGSQALLKMHMKCHERTARGATFRCTYCGKGFFESYNLQVHERTHRNERPFLCDICNTSFGTNSSLKRHLKVSHSTSKPFPCPTCQRCFVSASTRARHTARAHGDPASFPHACALCPRRYRACKDLQKHVHKAHPKQRKRSAEAVETDQE